MSSPATPKLSIDALAALIPDGARIALPPDNYSGCAMTIIRW